MMTVNITDIMRRNLIDDTTQWGMKKIHNRRHAHAFHAIDIPDEDSILGHLQNAFSVMRLNYLLFVLSDGISTDHDEKFN